MILLLLTLSIIIMMMTNYASPKLSHPIHISSPQPQKKAFWGNCK